MAYMTNQYRTSPTMVKSSSYNKYSSYPGLIHYKPCFSLVFILSTSKWSVLEQIENYYMCNELSRGEQVFMDNQINVQLVLIYLFIGKTNK